MTREGAEIIRGALEVIYKLGKSCFDGIKAWLNAPVEKIKELADRG